MSTTTSTAPAPAQATPAAATPATATPATATPAAAWTLRGRLGRAFTLLAVAMVVFAALAIFAAARFVLSGNAVINRWQPALSASQQVYADYQNQSGGLRSYLITGQRSSLQPYYDFANTRRTDTAKLRRLVGDDDGVERRIDAFQAALTQWAAGNARPLIAQKRGGVPIVPNAATKARAALVGTSADAVTSLLAKRVADTRSDRKISGIVAGVAVGLGLLVLTAAGLVFWRGLHRWVLGPVDRLSDQTRRVASGELTREIRGEGPAELVELGTDVESMRAEIVTQLARAETVTGELRQKGEELERSNGDLQQFAYVASHDLSEPLRKVANFCQLLERQYGPELDDRARQYIGFAVDGAKRMQTLINDLLALSRVGRNTDEFEPINMDAKVDQAIIDLGERITTSQATIERDGPLPTVRGDRALLVSLMENLIGNAVKYRRDDVPPVVRISAEVDDATRIWTFTVSDNGIGIDPQYAERIFAVFQRLHLRDQFGGTGIGLALCRRIVDFHGGKIWLDTVESGPGTTFRFTLPEGTPHA